MLWGRFYLFLFLPISTFAASNRLPEPCRRAQQAVIIHEALARFEDAWEDQQLVTASARFAGAALFGSQQGVERKLFAGGRDLLRARGTSLREVGETLEIEPSGATPLGRMAKDLKDKYGVRLVYSPAELTHFGATYDKRGRVIYLPHDSIRLGEPEIDTYHEALHAKFDHMLRNGEDSLFHGEFVTLVKGKPLWDNPAYPQYLSLEEAATYPDSLRRWGAELARGADALQRIRELSRTNADNNRLAREFIVRGVQGLGTGETSLTVRREELQNDRGENVEHFVAALRVGDGVFRFHIAYSSELRPGNLEGLAMGRLKLIHEVLRSGERNAERVFSLASGSSREGLVEATKAPAEAVAPYLDWNVSGSP